MGVEPEGSIVELLAQRAAENATAVALRAPGQPPLTYAALRDQVERTARALNAAGLGRGDRVAVVLPNGPDMAASFLGVASAVTCAPLNPAYKEAEFEFFLTDLQARALVVEAESRSPALAVAARMKIPVLRLVREKGSPAGAFTLDAKTDRPPRTDGLAHGDDVALVLHTSGTTSRPKQVPLTHRNLRASGRHIRDTLALTPADTCLNVMPLFHIHGLIAATLASLTAGASVVCTPGFDASRFFDWLTECKPTWYTAVPTMHQALLARVTAQATPRVTSTLRFIRSSSASLPATVMAALEEAFGVPVIEAYGMTEASHQMACNPLPPRARKPGSVGLAAGPEVAIMSPDGALLPSGTRGEVVIRGPNVTSGYFSNDAANAAAFTNGWFRTGDEGYLDADAYLFLTGRLKEMINRAGEKVSPREVDEVLLQHPAVATAVVFPVSHPTLGEDVAAAVILKPGAQATERELRAFASVRLADFKIPRQIAIVDAIPTGATGKLQRIGLADKLADKLRAAHTAPSTPTEKAIARIWADVLRVEEVSADDNYFALGGDSLSAMAVVGRARRERLDLDVAMLVRHPTLAELAAHVKPLVAVDPAKRPPGIETTPEWAERCEKIRAAYKFDIEEIHPGTPMQGVMAGVSLFAAHTHGRPGRPQHFIAQTRFAIVGAIDTARLRAAWSTLVRRHSGLRTTFHAQMGKPVAAVVARDVDLPWEEHDWRDMPASQQEAELAAFLRRDVERGYDVTAPPLCRVTAFRTAEDRCEVALSYWHPLLDNWSIALLLDEMLTLYVAEPGKPVELPPAQPFSTYSAALDRDERNYGPYLRALLAGFKQENRVNLRHEPAPEARLWGDLPTGGAVDVRFDAELTAAITSWSRAQRLTANAVLQGAWILTTAAFTGDKDILYMDVVSGRRIPLEGVERLVGCSLNFAYVRTVLDDAQEPVAWLDTVQTTLMEMAPYETIPVDFSRQTCPVPSDRASVHVLWNFLGVPPGWFGLERAGVTVTPARHEFLATYPLEIDIYPGRELLFRMRYNGSFFDEPGVKKLGALYRSAVEALVSGTHKSMKTLLSSLRYD